MDGKHWQAKFVPNQKVVGDYEVTAALLVSDLGSDVTAGENSGRHLNHDFAVLSLITRPLGAGNNGYQGAFIIDNHPREITGHLALAAPGFPALVLLNHYKPLAAGSSLT